MIAIVRYVNDPQLAEDSYIRGGYYSSSSERPSYFLGYKYIYIRILDVAHREATHLMEWNISVGIDRQFLY